MGTPQIQATLDGVQDAVNWLKKKHAFVEKAANTAVRIEGFRLKTLLQQEIKAGSPGGASFAPLSFIARRHSKSIQVAGGRTARLRPNRKPLERLALGVRYHVIADRPFTLAIGWVGPDTISRAKAALKPDANPLGRGISPGNITSKKWRYLASIHQEGFSKPITQAQRRWIINRGAELGTIDGGSTPFFLLKRTQTFTTPARPIMDPFWRRRRSEAIVNIDRNFKTKLQGLKV